MIFNMTIHLCCSSFLVEIFSWRKILLFVRMPHKYVMRLNKCTNKIFTMLQNEWKTSIFINKSHKLTFRNAKFAFSAIRTRKKIYHFVAHFCYYIFRLLSNIISHSRLLSYILRLLFVDEGLQMFCLFKR